MSGDWHCPACNRTHEWGEGHSLGMVCARCNTHTGNNHQGHYWGLCKVTGAVREMHFCCPDNCELAANDATTTGATDA